MCHKEQIRDFFRAYILSLDFGVAVTAFLIAFFFLPTWVSVDFTRSLFSVSVGALSIIFAVYFAALTTITAAGDDEFIRFLDLRGHLNPILLAFKRTLLFLFLALLYALALYAFSSFKGTSGAAFLHKATVVVFAPLATYSLIAAQQMAHSAIRYARERASYFRIDREKRESYLQNMLAESNSEQGPVQTDQDRDDD